jgi:hypothetical protein
MNVSQATSPKRMTRFALVVAAIATVFAPTQVRADYRCDEPKSALDQRVCAIAKQGPNELRRFIQRTQSIYQLYFFDYANDRDFARWDAEGRGEPSRAVAGAPAQRAQDASR